MTDHKPPEHNCERVGDIEMKYREELTTLSAESRAKVLQSLCSIDDCARYVPAGA